MKYNLPNLIAIVFGYLIIGPSHSQSQEEKPKFPNTDSVDSFVKEQMDQNHIPGLAAGIIKKDSLVWLETYGYADVEKRIAVRDSTLFMLASVSKTVTATALMNIAETGAFQLDDDVNNYLPFSVRNPNYPKSSITFRMLLTHTSSLKDEWPKLLSFVVVGDPPISLDEFLRGYLTSGGAHFDRVTNFNEWEPGSRYQYSNIGFALIGYLVEVISGQSFDQYCREYIFAPLSMDRSSWVLRDMNISEIAMPYSYKADSLRAEGHYGYADYPAGLLRSNVPEMARFLSVYMQNGTLHHQTILYSTTISLMTTVAVPFSKDLNRDESGVGLTWFKRKLEGRDVWGHRGGDPGVSTFMFYDPNELIGIIVLSNGGSKDLTPIGVKLFEFASSIPEN